MAMALILWPIFYLDYLLHIILLLISLLQVSNSSDIVLIVLKGKLEKTSAFVSAYIASETLLTVNSSTKSSMQPILG